MGEHVGGVRLERIGGRGDRETVHRRSWEPAGPQDVVEVLGEDTHHDLRRKDEVCADLGITRRAGVEPYKRYRSRP